ncbi:MAG: Omp28-related outer membrane protein [Bacteroidales bacterium]|jgi:thiol-disulfide isomerase/thioredoxin|nr:Omp28-related outer membrane protein [Bacteroidales bacterium]
MKNSIFNLKNLILCIGMLLFAGCDKIEDPIYKIIEDVEVQIPFPDLDTLSVFRKILIEEYTGHYCSNCPKGHEKLAELANRYGDTLVMIGIHAGSSAQVLPLPELGYPEDFRTTMGTQLAEDFGVYGIPSAVINRATTPNIDVSSWEQDIQNANRAKPVAALQLNRQWVGEQVVVGVKTTLLSPYENPVLLSLFLIEDSIVAPQLNGSVRDSAYVHKHVLRASFSEGTYGNRLSQTGVLAKDSSYTRGFTITFAGETWRREHCTAIAILQNEISREVLQTEELHLK